MIRHVLFAVTAALIFLLVAVALYPEGDSDIMAVLKDMRSSLKEFNTRLARVEQLVKELPRKDNKSAKRQKAVQPVPETLTASAIVESQDAYQRGRTAEDRGSYDPAIAQYTRAIELDPNNDTAYLHRGYAYFYAGRLDLALADLSQSLSIQPHNSQAYEFRSRIYNAMHDYPHALADLDEALKRDFNPTLLLAKAAIEEERGNLQTAINIYGAVVVRQPNSAVALLKRAKDFEQLKQTDRALADCSAAINAHPDLAEAYVCRADAHIRNNAFPAAIADLNTALKLNPNSVEVSRMIAAVRDTVALNEQVMNKQMAASSAPAAATPSFPASSSPASGSRVVTLPGPAAPVSAAPVPTSSNPAVAQAPSPQIARSVPQPVTPSGPLPPPPSASAASAPVVAQTSESVPDAVKARQIRRLINSGRDKLNQGRFDEATQDLSQAIQLDPSNALAYNSRGYAELRSCRYQDALSDFNTAIQLNPDYANAHFNLGATLQILGERASSREHLQKAAELQRAAASAAAAGPAAANRKP